MTLCLEPSPVQYALTKPGEEKRETISWSSPPPCSLLTVRNLQIYTTVYVIFQTDMTVTKHVSRGRLKLQQVLYRISQLKLVQTTIQLKWEHLDQVLTSKEAWDAAFWNRHFSWTSQHETPACCSRWTGHRTQPYMPRCQVQPLNIYKSGSMLM